MGRHHSTGRVWRLPVALTIGVHGAAAFWALVFPRDEAPGVRSGPEIEFIVMRAVETTRPEETAVGEEPAPSVTKPERRRGPGRRKRHTDGPAEPESTSGETPASARAPGPDVRVERREPMPRPSRLADGAVRRPPSERLGSEKKIDLKLRVRPPPAPPLTEFRKPSDVHIDDPLMDVLDRLNPLARRSRADRPAGGGGRVVESANVDLRVDADGTATFEEKLPFDLGGAPQDPDRAHDLRIHQGGPYRTSELADQGFKGLQIGFSADLFGALLPREMGQAEKLRLFEETEGVRAELNEEACAQRLRTSLFELRDDLERVWADDGMTVAERKRLLFARWDECAESGTDEVLLYAMAARATIIAFIRNRLPSGSKVAYTQAELSALNARRESAVAFEPYLAREP